MKVTLILSAILVTGLFSSCNTTIGVGRDMRILGENMEKAAVKGQGSGGGGSDDYSGAPVY